MAEQPSLRTLEEAPARATNLLAGLASNPAIFTLMHTLAHMTVEDVSEGVALLNAAIVAPRAPLPAAVETPEAKAQHEANATLDAWDEPNFRRFAAQLERHFPEQGAYVFDGLSASTGPQAARGIATFLARLDALETGSDPARAKTRDDDKKAVALLAKRGLPKEERARLAALTVVALGGVSTVPVVAFVDDAERVKHLVNLHGWWKEWSEAAHAHLKRKSHLIALGLASRKKPKAPPAP